LVLGPLAVVRERMEEVVVGAEALQRKTDS
jgi:hypothetical protein